METFTESEKLLLKSRDAVKALRPYIKDPPKEIIEAYLACLQAELEYFQRRLMDLPDGGRQ